MDISVATAARLSSTFPYVSPIARPDYPEGTPSTYDSRAYHLADGGYFDNHGVATAIDFLDELIEADTSLTDILFIQLRLNKEAEKEAETDKGWLYAYGGPLVTLVNMRTQAQIDRNQSQLQLLQEKWEGSGRDINIDPVTFRLERDLSLSWHLSHSEIDQFEGAWRDTTIQKNCNHVVSYFKPKDDARMQCESLIKPE